MAPIPSNEGVRYKFDRANLTIDTNSKSIRFTLVRRINPSKDYDHINDANLFNFQFYWALLSFDSQIIFTNFLTFSVNTYPHKNLNKLALDRKIVQLKVEVQLQLLNWDMKSCCRNLNTKSSSYRLFYARNLSQSLFVLYSISVWKILSILFLSHSEENP